MTEFSGDTPTMIDDHALAAGLARDAGELLLGLRARVGFADPKGLKDAGDRESHEFLMAALARHRPDDAVLSEEGPPEERIAPRAGGDGVADTARRPARLSADRVWIIDPLDGTREFGEEGRADWAVHVALWEKGTLAAGAVALPAQRRTLGTAAGGGAEIIDADTGARAPLALRDDTDVSRIRMTVSRSRPPRFVQRLAEHLADRGGAAELVPIGSAGAKISAVLLGEVDAYVHAGGQYEWDSAAPAAVALAAGAHASRIDGAELAYNQEDPTLPDILVCHPVLAPTLLAGIRDVNDA